MRCEEAREFLSAVVDGEVAGAIQEGAAKHVGACPRCQALVEDYRRIGRALGSAREVASPQLTAAVRQRLLQERSAQRPKRTWIAPHFARQTAMLALVAG